MAPESDFKMDLSNVLPPGSSTRLEVIEIIASSAKFQDAGARKTFFRNSALADYTDSFDLSGGSQEFAERILPDLLDIGKLDLFLQWLLETDKSLNPERKQFLKKEVLREDQSASKSAIRAMRAESLANPASIAFEQPKKLDKQVLVRYGLSESDQIPKLIKLVESGQGCGVFSIFLEGYRKITKEYIASRIILELREKQGIIANIHDEIHIGDLGNNFSESIATLNKKIEDVKTYDMENQCYIFLLRCYSQFPKRVVESSFETFLNHQCVQDLQAKQNCCFMFIWIFERSQFKKTEIKKLERQITHFPIYKIVLKSFRSVIRTSFNEVGLCDRLDECFEKLDELKGEFFPTYEYLDETFVNPPIY